MMKSLRWCILMMFSAAYLFAQVGSSEVKDTLSAIAEDENLLEQSVEDSPIIDVMTPEVQSKSSLPSLSLRSRLIQKFQKSKGYANGAYAGSSLKSYQRLTATVGNRYTGVLLVAKDAGERMMNEFSSWNLTATDIGPMRKAVAGSYRIETGQGIALWRGYDFSKGADVVTPVKRKPRGLISSLSTDEVEYFKGVAAEIAHGSVSATVFYSHRSLSSSKNTLGAVTSLYNSGYFRTEGELSKRDNLTEQLYGVHAACNFSQRDHIGLTYYRTMFSSPLLFDSGKRFSGTGYSLIAMEYNIGYRSVTLFGEWARVNSSLGGISGLGIRPGNDVTLIVSVRNFPYRFVSLHGLGFGEGLSTLNEQGLYIGVRLQPMRSLVLSLYYDQFIFPEKTSLSRFSTKGNDALVEVLASPSRKCKAVIRYQRKFTEEQSDLTELAVDMLRVQRIRLQLEYEVSRSVQLRGRAEWVFLDWKNSPQCQKGLMIYQDITLKSHTRCWWNIRIMFFHTDSYSTRMYAYERDLEGVLSMPALYGRGLRWYGMVRYTLTERIELSAKYSDIIRDDVKHIGSGLDELPANHDNRIGVQLDVRF